MQGAREFAKLFRTGQYGRLYVVSGSHARGKTFHVYVLPEGETGAPNGPDNAPLNRDAVEVYGVLGGQPGWTEWYGWLHDGPWQKDFSALVEKRRSGIIQQEKQNEIEKQARIDAESSRVSGLLSSYK